MVIREDEATDGSHVFLAEIPNLPGCMSHGDTREEALQNLCEAYELYTDALSAHGKPLARQPIVYTLGTFFSGLPTAVEYFSEVDADLELNLKKPAA